MAIVNPLGDGIGGYRLILAVAVVAHEPWRWLGASAGQSLQPGGQMFLWVRAISNDLIAGLISRLTIFPHGQLETVPLSIWLFAGIVGLVIFYGTRQNLAAGLLAASGALMVGINII